MFVLVVIRKGDKSNDNEQIYLLHNFLWFLGVEIKWHEYKIGLPTELLADTKNARSQYHVFADFPARIFSVSAFLKTNLDRLCCGTCSWVPHDHA